MRHLARPSPCAACLRKHFTKEHASPRGRAPSGGPCLVSSGDRERRATSGTGLPAARRGQGARRREAAGHTQARVVTATVPRRPPARARRVEGARRAGSSAGPASPWAKGQSRPRHHPAPTPHRRRPARGRAPLLTASGPASVPRRPRRAPACPSPSAARALLPRGPPARTSLAACSRGGPAEHAHRGRGVLRQPGPSLELRKARRSGWSRRWWHCFVM